MKKVQAAGATYIAAGVITMAWQADGTPLEGILYLVSKNGITPPVQWLEGGTCLLNGFC